VPEDGQQDLLGHLKEVLSLRRTLLVLDNFEHVLSAGSDVGALLQETAGLKVLVTSREVLRLSGEHVFEVPALAIPGPRDRWSPATLGEYSAVDLFVRRLAASRPTFAVTPRNAASIAEICQRLDGLPLAIELAAARGKHLPLRTLLARLDDRFSSLRAGPRDYPRRHQTLRSALEWSYELLDPAERRLFARLGVFVGGTIEAISAVCAEGQEGMEEVEGRLESLVDKSLVQREWGTDDEARFTMLGTLREYAVGWLAQGGELDTYRRRHLAYYRSLAEQAAPELTGAQQGAWLARLEREHDNLRAALRWALTREDGEGAARLGAALWRFWWAHGHLTEGRRWMEETLALLEGVEAADDLRARVLTGVGVLARVHGDVARARTALDQALVIWKQLGTTREMALVLTNLGLLGEVEGDQRAEDYLRQSLAAWREVADARGTAHALHNLAWLAIVRVAYDQARPLLGESLALFRNLHDDWSCALVLRNLAWVAIEEGKTDHAVELLEEALARSRDLGDDAGCANSLSHLGLAYYRRGDLERAVQLLEESLATCRILGERRALANVMHNLGVVVQERGDVVRATDYLVESLRIFHSLGDLRGVAECLEALSGAVASRGRATDAAQLLRAAGGLRERTGAPIARTFRAAYERAVRVVEARAGQATTESAPTDGPPASLDRIADEVAEFLAISPGSGETDVSAVGPTIAERPGSAATATSGTVRSSQPAKSGPGVTLHASWRKRAS
jgi:predicted ATPase